jgi:phage-related protein
MFLMAWSVEFLNDELRLKLESFPTDIVASFLRISRMIEGHGLLGMREPYVKHLEGSLWEMRMKGRSGIARAVYVSLRHQRVVIVHVFVKKTEKTPRREIDLALRRAGTIK